MRIVLRLLKFLVPFTGWVLLSIAFSVMTVASGVGLLATSAYLIASAALHPSIAELQVAIVGVRAFGLARGLFRYLERYVSHTVNFRLLSRLRAWFYRSLESLAPARLLFYRSGDLLSRAVADVEMLENFYVRAVAPLATAVVMSAAVWVFLNSYHPRLAWIALAFLLVVGVVLPVIFRLVSREPGRTLVDSRAVLHADLVAGIQGVADLQAFGRDAVYLERLRREGDDLAAAQRCMGWISAAGAALNTLFSNLGVLAVIVAAIPLVRNGSISGVSLGVLALAVGASFEAVLPLSLAAQFLEASLHAGRRLFEIVDVPPAVVDPVPVRPFRGAPDLSVERLSFCYVTGDPPALRDISFSLPAGKRLALVGPSGAGKTTILNLLLRFWDCDQGKILLDGIDLRHYAQESVRAQVSVISQSTYIFNDSLRANLLLARPDATPQQLEETCRRAQLWNFVQGLPQGLGTWVGERGLQLSGGERQRLAVARALLKDTPFLFFDEPTANLDAATEQGVVAALLALGQGKSTLWATHRLVGLDALDEIIVLDYGRVVERGIHADLLMGNGLYWKMWEAQNRILDLDNIGVKD